jgi:RNA polymerase sigma-70 factor (ECF subfamily)
VLYAGVLLPRLGNEADAEDLLRETLLTVALRIGSYTYQERSIYYWMRQIALHKLIDAYRKRRRGERAIAALAEEAETAPGGELPADEALIAHEERRRNRERIARTLAQLNPRYAEAIRLRLVEELPRADCAARLGVTVPTFDVLFFRAVQAFRKRYLEE